MAPASWRSMLVVCLCGIQGRLASAEGAATAPRFHAEVQPGSSAIFLTKSQAQSHALEEKKIPAETNSLTTALHALAPLLQHVATLGVGVLLEKQQGQHAHRKHSPGAKGAPQEAPQPQGSWGRLAVGILTCMFLGWATRAQKRRSEKERYRLVACLQEAVAEVLEAKAASEMLAAEMLEAKAAAEMLEAENAELLSRATTYLSTSGLSSPRVEEPPKEALVDVFLRVRPHYERQAGGQCVLRVKDTEVVLDMAHKGTTQQSFSFKGILDSNLGSASQEDVFNMVGKQAVESVLDGYHTCVFAFGQTGTGKTHTLIGSPGDPGLLPRIIRSLLEEEKEPFRLSCVEIYLDKLRDLLVPDYASGYSRLEIRGDATGGFSLTNLREVLVEDPQVAIKLINKASQNRVTASTSMNSTSSRGHAIYQLEFATGAKLLVVDLAGRENERSTGCKGHNLVELAYINKSLFHLTQVLQALGRPGAQQGLVPFRNSKLTMLLSECLQGARMTLVATVSPDSSNAEDTHSIMRIAKAVREITTKSRRNTGTEFEDEDTRGSPRGMPTTGRRRSI